VRRREFIILIGSAVVRLLTAHAQQQPMPVIGFLRGGSAGPVEHLMAVFRQTLADAGYVEGRNVAIEVRSAEGHYERLPELATDLLRRQVAVIVAIPDPAALAAKAATEKIPIVFAVANDPVELGLVDSIAHPKRNATGIGFFNAELGSKRLGLSHELVPAATQVGLLVNPDNRNADAVTRDLVAKGSAMGLQINVVRASTASEIEAAFAVFVRDVRDEPKADRHIGGSF
jgi:putative ABC transport system substrate-binding protein